MVIFLGARATGLTGGDWLGGAQVSPLTELRDFVAGFVGPVLARVVIERVGLVTVEDLGDVKAQQLVDAGMAHEAAEMLLAVALERGYGETIRRRREEERRRAREHEVRVPAGDDERDERPAQLVLELGGEHVAFEMIDRNEGLVVR